MNAPDQPDLRSRIDRALDHRSAGRAGILDAVMAEVQPVLDAKDAQIAQATDQAWRITVCHNAAKAMNGIYQRNITRWRQRAEAAEERLAEIREEGRDL